ncbi:hypothetical protein CPB97_009857 [Podila verticillata]|nr:hypothetical protein CPB97_009857 [Podila verticillata]
MAPSLPGRRSTTRGSSSSLRRENSFSKRDNKRHESEDEDEDEEPASRRSSARSKRPVRKATMREKIIDIPLEDDEEEDNEEEENDMASVNTDDIASGEGDGEENEGETDDSGEAKITLDGELLGGREYKCKSFKLPDRGDKIYMLSMDPARVLGFRDSYLFFIKNPHLARIITTSEERAWMIREGLLMPNFKNKLIAVVSARSIFKSFGARIIKNGRSKVDDYYEAGVDGSVMDDSADEGTEQGEETKLTTNGATEEAPRAGPGRKRALPKPEEPARTVTDLTWQYEGAMTVRAFNNQLKEMRKENPKFLDPHTNIEQGPLAFQPTRIHVQKVEQDDFRHTRDEDASQATVVSIPRTVGPKVDTTVKVEIKGGPPGPPLINDPNVWAAIPEDIRRALQDAETDSTEETYEHRKYPISVMHGQFQASYPVHQARFKQPYRLILPQSMGAYAQQIHQMFLAQPRVDVPQFEQKLLADGSFPPQPQEQRAASTQPEPSQSQDAQPQPQPQPQLASTNPYSRRR